MNHTHPIFAPLLAAICPPATVVCPACGGECYVEGTGYDPRLGYDVTRQYVCRRCDGTGVIHEQTKGE